MRDPFYIANVPVVVWLAVGGAAVFVVLLAVFGVH